MSSSPVISIRVSAEERELLENASATLGVKLSDFMRRRSLEAAEIALSERRRVEIPVAAWEAVEAFMAAPARSVPALEKLAQSTPTWDE